MWERHAIRSWCKGHFEHVRGHHKNEDELFNPFLRTRIIYPDKLETDHIELVEMTKRLEAVVSGALASVDELGALWDEYEGIMLPHLREEENIGIPLMRAYFTPKEIGALQERIIKTASPLELGSFVHHLGGKAESIDFMRQAGIPLPAWYMAFKPNRALYRKRMQSLVDSLLTGRHVITAHKPKKPAATGSMARSRTGQRLPQQKGKLGDAADENTFVEPSFMQQATPTCDVMTVHESWRQAARFADARAVYQNGRCGESTTKLPSWQCPSCSSSNFSIRAACYRCAVPKPPEPRVAVGSEASRSGFTNRVPLGRLS